MGTSALRKSAYWQGGNAAAQFPYAKYRLDPQSRDLPRRSQRGARRDRNAQESIGCTSRIDCRTTSPSGSTREGTAPGCKRGGTPRQGAGLGRRGFSGHEAPIQRNQVGGTSGQARAVCGDLWTVDWCVRADDLSLGARQGTPAGSTTRKSCGSARPRCTGSCRAPRRVMNIHERAACSSGSWGLLRRPISCLPAIGART